MWWITVSYCDTCSSCNRFGCNGNTVTGNKYVGANGYANQCANVHIDADGYADAYCNTNRNAHQYTDADTHTYRFAAHSNCRSAVSYSNRRGVQCNGDPSGCY
jgi:hypothetical protein